MKRMRPVNSCLPCRKRRLRCDKEHPSCGRCVAGRAQCRYDEGSLPEQPEGTEERPMSSSPTTLRSNAMAGRSGIEKGRLSVSRGGRSSYKGATFWANAIPYEFLQDDEFGCDTPNNTSPYCKWPAGKNNAHLFRPPKPGNIPLHESSNQCRYCGRAYRLSCIQSLLPNRTTCEKLCDIFFATVFPLIPILHVGDFVHDFETFWGEVETRRHHQLEPAPIIRVKPAFLCLLPAMLFATLSSTSPSRIESVLGEESIPSVADMYLAAMACATLTGFPRSPTLYSLAAYIIVQSQFIREEEFSDSPDFVGTAFRLALGMGLHRHLPEATFTSAELEMRRRLWWYIIHLDVMASASSGMSPLFLDEKMANATMIHQYDETEDESEKRAHRTDVRYLVAVKRYEVTKAIRLILRSHFEDAFDSSNRLSEILRQLAEITKDINQTTELLLDVSSSPQISRNGSSVKVEGFKQPWSLELCTEVKEARDFATWSALLLHMMIHKAYCILYHPLFKNATSADGISVRESAVKHAQAFLQLFIRVCDDTVSEPFHWMYPGTYQPFQALSLLLADMLQHPRSDEASLSRGIVDATFSLYRIDEGFVSQADPSRRELSSTGRSTWSMLARTRKKALEIIGEDHHILLPSQVICADNCVCGERIAGARQAPATENCAEPQAQDNPFLASRECEFLEDTLGISEALFSNEFNWQEFEASIAPEAGFIS